MQISKNQLYLSGAAILAVVALVFCWQTGAFSAFATSQSYKAVFLTNNQVFFGQLAPSRNGFVNLTHVYYIKDQAPLVDPAQSGSDLSLLKLGRELHAPKDNISISRENILYMQDLSDNSRVLAAIHQANSSQ